MTGFGKGFEKKKQNKNQEKIIHQAFLYHSQGNIKEAFKNYKYCHQFCH